MKKVALTFDDGPWGNNTDIINKILSDNKISATFMIWGEHVLKYPDELKSLALNDFFEFGNHTFHHYSLTNLSSSEIDKEIELTDKVVENAINKKMRFVRPPFGQIDEKALLQINRPIILWSLDTLSWKYHNKLKVLEQIRNVKDGDIILMHDNQEADVLALPEIINYLKNNGFEFLTVSELLSLDYERTPSLYFSQYRVGKEGIM